ncbi:hypothetical protein PG999_007378 [Apiospora kogelbergensis]|uniref:Uncharacterized protein n=1 Tax=Apiospora kogelbergensis TaxID=1337665 RepID=A0AAW0QY44_9PEZI
MEYDLEPWVKEIYVHHTEHDAIEQETNAGDEVNNGAGTSSSSNFGNVFDWTSVPDDYLSYQTAVWKNAIEGVETKWEVFRPPQDHYDPERWRRRGPSSTQPLFFCHECPDHPGGFLYDRQLQLHRDDKHRQQSELNTSQEDEDFDGGDNAGIAADSGVNQDPVISFIQWPSISIDPMDGVPDGPMIQPKIKDLSDQLPPEGSDPAAVPKATTEGMGPNDQQSPMNQQENTAISQVLDPRFHAMLQRMPPGMREHFQSQPAEKLTEMVAKWSQSPVAPAAPAAGQQAALPPVGHMYRPEEVRYVEGLTSSSTMIYESGLRALYNVLKRRGPGTADHMSAKDNIMVTSRMIESKHELTMKNGQSASDYFGPRMDDDLTIILHNIAIYILATERE